MGQTKSSALFPAIRRRLAGIRGGRGCVSRRADLGQRAGIRIAENDRSGQGQSTAGRNHGGNTQSAGNSCRSGVLKNTPQAEKHRPIRKTRRFRRFHVVEEGGCKFWVNFEDYLDTGLFLDHRPLRLLIQQQAQGKCFLNLFAYTGSATVHAAIGGAVSSVTVDMSNTYLDWARRNFVLNEIHGDHKLVRANCAQWLTEQAGAKPKPQFDLIFLDPPTFSNSKKMDEAFDIQKDHVLLIRNAAALLAPGGDLYFSTNFRRFKMDHEALRDLIIEDISAKMIPEDFARDAKIHYCWKISH